MGTSDATIGIRNALAMGAASAVHILDNAVAGSDTLATAKILAAAIKKQAFDLVLCATESSDSYSGIVAGQIAYFLGVPPVTFAKEITVEGDQISIKRQSETGYDIVAAKLPALVSCSSGINEPRYPQLKGIMAAKKKEIKVYTASDLGSAPMRWARRVPVKKCLASAVQRSVRPVRQSRMKAKAANRSQIFSLK
jgi:electron transfer flavoprotein beta subunit